MVPSSPIPECGVGERGPRQEEETEQRDDLAVEGAAEHAAEDPQQNRTSRGEISARSASTQPTAAASQGGAVPRHLFPVMPSAPGLA